MPALPNQKHEQFCQLIFAGARYGWTQGTCYQRAGYRTTAHAAETAASRLMKNVVIQQRLAELGGSGARKARLTADTLIGKLDVVFDGSVEAKQYSAAGRAVETQGKLAGLMVDRVEVGRAGEFEGLQTAEEVLAVVEQELGPETRGLLAAALERRELPVSVKIDSYARELLKVATIEQATEALLRVASDQALVVT